MYEDGFTWNIRLFKWSLLKSGTPSIMRRFFANTVCRKNKDPFFAVFSLSFLEKLNLPFLLFVPFRYISWLIQEPFIEALKEFVLCWMQSFVCWVLKDLLLTKISIDSKIEVLPDPLGPCIKFLSSERIKSFFWKCWRFN